MTTDRIEIIREALRQTEMRLEDLQTNAAAAETRAYQFCAATVLLATFATTVAERTSNPFTTNLAAIVLAFSGFLAFHSVLPRRFHVRGHYWKEWKGHLDDRDTLEVALTSQAEENDDRIRFNEKNLEKCGSEFFLSFLVAALSVAIFGLGVVLKSI